MSTVRIVLFSVPHLAAVIVQLSDPFVLGGITVVMAGLVMWAFWPTSRPRTPQPPREGEPGVADGEEAGPEEATRPDRR